MGLLSNENFLPYSRRDIGMAEMLFKQFSRSISATMAGRGFFYPQVQKKFYNPLYGGSSCTPQMKTAQNEMNSVFANLLGFAKDVDNSRMGTTSYHHQTAGGSQHERLFFYPPVELSGCEDAGKDFLRLANFFQRGPPKPDFFLQSTGERAGNIERDLAIFSAKMQRAHPHDQRECGIEAPSK
jgi:hypothetical protein